MFCILFGSFDRWSCYHRFWQWHEHIYGSNLGFRDIEGKLSIYLKISIKLIPDRVINEAK